MRRFSGANHQSVSRSNRSTLFRALYALAPISRVELASETGLNAGTVTNIVDELLASGLVRESDRAHGTGTRVGRRRVLLEVTPDARYAIGVDLARNQVTGGIVDLAGNIVRTLAEPTGPLAPEHAGAQIADIVARLRAGMSAAEQSRLIGIGIGAPGALSVRSGIFLPPASYGNWEGVDLRRDIARTTGLETAIDNNGNTSTLAELWFGRGTGLSNFVLLNLGTGLGAGFVLDGELFRGEHDLAGEVGHISVAMSGPRCACGNQGCLELYVSVPRILASLQAAIATGEPTMLRSGEVTIDTFIAAARAGDAMARRVMADTARSLAAGIVTIVNMLDPEIVILGRDLARAGDLLVEPTLAEVRQRVLPFLRESVRIETSTLADAPVRGAAILPLQRFFDSPLAAP